MSVDDIIAACGGLDCKRWKSGTGVDIYPPQDPCDYRVIAWERFFGEGWIVEIEQRAAFYWEVKSTRLAETPEQVRAIADETFANDETAKATLSRRSIVAVGRLMADIAKGGA